MALSAQTTITDALLLTGFASFEAAPEADAMSLGVRTANRMLGEWSSKGWVNPLQDVSTVTPAHSNYITMGTNPPTGTTVDLAKDYVWISDVIGIYGNIRYILRSVNLAEYQRIASVPVTAVPSVYAWDYQNPVSTLWFYPYLMSTMQIRITGAPKITLTEPQGTIALDDTYEETFVYNLAVKMYPYLKLPTGIDPELVKNAQASLNGLKARARVMRAGKTKTEYRPGASGSTNFWQSPLNVAQGPST